MPYLVAKNFYQHGCYAMPVEHGPELVELKRDLQAATSLEHLREYEKISVNKILL